MTQSTRVTTRHDGNCSIFSVRELAIQCNREFNWKIVETQAGQYPWNQHWRVLHRRETMVKNCRVVPSIGFFIEIGRTRPEKPEKIVQYQWCAIQMAIKLKYLFCVDTSTAVFIFPMVCNGPLVSFFLSVFFSELPTSPKTGWDWLLSSHTKYLIWNHAALSTLPIIIPCILFQSMIFIFSSALSELWQINWVLSRTQYQM